MARIVMSGRDWTQPDTRTDWQKERAAAPLLPMEEEFTGRWRYLTWGTCFVVVTLLIAALLS